MSLLTAVWLIVAVPLAVSLSSAARTVIVRGRSQPLVVMTSELWFPARFGLASTVRSLSLPLAVAKFTVMAWVGRVLARRV